MNKFDTANDKNQIQQIYLMKNDSAIFRQRKLTSSSRPNLPPEFDLSARFNTSTSLMNPLQEPSTQSELKKIIISLQKSLKEEKQKHLEAEEKLMRYMKRADQRQKEFHNILANKSSAVYMQTGGDTNVQKLYEQVMGKVSESEEKMREKFEMRYKENMNVTDRKIKGIIELMQNHLKKAASLSEQQHGQLKTNINRLQAVALQIDIENTNLIKLNSQLQFKVKLLRQEKNLLIQQLNEKKQLCKKYFERAKLCSRHSSRAESEGVEEEKSETRSKNSSLGKRKDLGNKDKKKGENNFAIELIRSKMFPAHSNQLPSQNINLSTSNMLSSKKQYISSMTIASNNPQINLNNRQQLTQTSRPMVKPSPYLLKKTTNSFHSTLVNSTIKPSYPQTPHNRQSSTISSLKNIISREKQKKLQYQNMLAEIQQKIIAIDKIIVEGLVFVKEKEEQEQQTLMSNLVFRKTSHKGIEEQVIVKGINEKDLQVSKVLKSVCDRIKNIISGNVEQNMTILRNDINIAMDLNPVTFSSTGRNVTNQQLLDLLKVE